jgi:hypothetical protein
MARASPTPSRPCRLGPVPCRPGARWPSIATRCAFGRKKSFKIIFSIESLELLPNASKRETFYGKSLETDSHFCVSPKKHQKLGFSSF